MEPEAVSARVSLGITILLALLYQHGKSQESIPDVAYFKLVDAFMLASTVFVFLNLVELCLVILSLGGFGQMKAAKMEKLKKRWSTVNYMD